MADKQSVPHAGESTLYRGPDRHFDKIIKATKPRPHDVKGKPPTSARTKAGKDQLSRKPVGGGRAAERPSKGARR